MNRVFIIRLILFSLVVPCAVPSYARQSAENNPTSLHMAIVDGDIEKVKSILSGGMDVNARNRINGTPLHTAVEKQRKEIVQLLLEMNADPNLVNNNRQTPLHIAVNTGQKDVVELLIAKGADVNAVDAMIDNALSLAQKRGHGDIAELLIEHGAKDPKLVMDEYGLDGDRRGQGRGGPPQDSGTAIQRQPNPMQAQSEPEVDILADPNEITARIKTFEGLDKSIEEVASKSRLGIRRWRPIKTDNRTTLIRVVQRQLEDELEFIRTVALEEKAKKTADQVDALFKKKKERTTKILKELIVQAKEQRQTRTGARSRGRSTRGARGMNSQDSGYAGRSGAYPEQSVARGVDQEPAEPVDVEEQNEINQWLQADVQDYDGKVSLFTAINEQIQIHFIVLRNLSEEEEAKKTTATIDGLLLARKLRYEELNQYIQEDRVKLESQENQTGRTRAGQQGTTGQESQTGRRRRR